MEQDQDEQTGLTISDGTRQVLMDMLKPYDRNGDGRLNLKEIEPALDMLGYQPKSKEELKFLCEKLDKNNDKTVSFDELLDNVDLINAHSVSGDDLMNAFRKLDTSRNGYITNNELKWVLMAPGQYQLSEEEARQVALELESEFDVNHDGRLDYNEFVRMWMNSNIVARQKTALGQTQETPAD